MRQEQAKRLTIKIFYLLLIIAYPAHAALIDNGDGTITDTATGLMWLQDTTLYKDTVPDSNRNWASANAWAEDLFFAGYDDWRLPSAENPDGTLCSGFDCIESELGSLFYGALGNTAGSLTNPGPFIFDYDINGEPDSTWFWTSTFSGMAACPWVCADTYWRFQFENGYQQGGDSFSWASNPLFAWAVRDTGAIGIAGIMSVSEPPAWLLSLSILLLSARHRIKTFFPRAIRWWWHQSRFNVNRNHATTGA